MNERAREPPDKGMEVQHRGFLQAGPRPVEGNGLVGMDWGRARAAFGWDAG